MDEKIYLLQMHALKRAFDHLRTLDLADMLEDARSMGEAEDARMIELARQLIAQLPNGHL